MKKLTGKMVQPKGCPIPIFQPNDVTPKGPDWYISYNSSCADYGIDTTALVFKHSEAGTIFNILCGDHQGPFEKCETLEAARAYVAKNADQLHEYSETVESVLKFNRTITR